MPKNAQTTAQLHLFHHASKVVFKILHDRLQQYMNQEPADVQVDLEKAEEPDQIANICWTIKKQGNSRKTFASLTTLKPLTMWITTNCGKFLEILH